MVSSRSHVTQMRKIGLIHIQNHFKEHHLILRTKKDHNILKVMGKYYFKIQTFYLKVITIKKHPR